MSYEQDVKSLSRTAAVDLSTSKNRFVSQSNLGLISPSAAGVQALGVLRNNPPAGGTGTVAFAGTVRVQVGAVAVTCDDSIASDANGLAITAASGNFINGKAMASGAPGEVIPVLLRFSGKAA